MHDNDNVNLFDKYINDESFFYKIRFNEIDLNDLYFLTSRFQRDGIF